MRTFFFLQGVVIACLFANLAFADDDEEEGKDSMVSIYMQDYVQIMYVLYFHVHEDVPLYV